MAPFDDTVIQQSGVQQPPTQEPGVSETDGDSPAATAGDTTLTPVPATSSFSALSLASPGELVTHAAADIDQAIDHAGFLSGAEVTEELTRVVELTAKLEAYRVALVNQVKKTEAWRQNDPNGTPVSFLRRELTLDHREASADLRLADGCEEFPELADALRSGTISRAAADLMLSIGLRNPQRQAMFPKFVALFIEVAHNGTLSRLRQSLRAWADQVDPLTTAADEDDAFHRRYLHISELADGVKLDGFFDTVSGMKIMAAINGAFTAQYKATHRGGELFGSDLDDGELANQAGELLTTDGGQDGGDDCVDRPETPPIVMSGKQRADAFISFIVEPALAGGLLPTCGGALPHVLVTVSSERLQGPTTPTQDVEALGQSILDDQIDHQSAHIATSNGPGRHILSGTAAQMLSCDATIQRVVLGPNSLPLDIGRTTRLIPTHIRRALTIRDQGCVFPFCDKPPGWTEAHHVQHWADGGPTNLHNLVLLCSKHHHEVHKQNHEIRTDLTGRPQITLKHWVRE